MKKSDALKKVPVEFIGKVKPLDRLGLYYLISNQYGFGEGKAIPVMITHFYEHGIKMKVLVKNQHLSHNGYYHIRYSRLERFSFKPMPAEDLPLFAGEANEMMSNAFLRSKAFKKS
jgi:hypothetical protein